ncbi:DUF2194 domain-containing protein [uncultured Maribacter sp.]|uniref:DUF2194 domain-containing protein n=1 Tax=uncultured Maribacter sp. TaxID=431308 RepID=UPI002618FEBA|nr:DUF2194 domain-containing protein [uncultured Maribacter sp.]
MIKNIKYGLFIFLLGLTIGCQRDIYRFTHEFSIPEKSKELPLVQFLVSKNEYSNAIESKNLYKALDYTKIPYKNLYVKDFNEVPKIAPTTRVLCIYETTPLNDNAIKAILNFVAKGGTLYVTKAIKDERISFLLGLNPDANWETNLTAQGYHLISPIFPGKQGLKYNDDGLHLGFSGRNFSDNTQVLVCATNNNDYPVLLENKIGKGRVILFNSATLLNKSMRGFMFSSILKGLEGIPYPIANVATIFLDDFPAPTYSIYKEPIKSELNITVTDYVKDVWWPDMKKFALEQNMEYTAYVTFDYNAHVIPPFTFKEWDRNTVVKNGSTQKLSAWIARDVLKSGHELGFHGYNHVSLLKSDWKNPKYIVTGLDAAEKKWKVLDFKSLPTSYVPPSNYIDSVGLAKLHEGMPSLKYMQSIYLGTKEEGGDREFDPDPYNDKFFDFPRISSGYVLEKTNTWAIESMYICTGIWTHFVHPDDVYQIPDASNAATSGHFSYRNKHKLNWYSKNGKKGMFDTFKDHIYEYKRDHPFSRFINATKASEKTMDWRYAYYRHSNFDGLYEVESTNARNKDKSNFWLMYVDNANLKLVDELLEGEEVEVKKTAMLDGFLYSVKTRNPSISVPDLFGKSGDVNIPDNVVLSEVNKAYELYLKNKKLMAPMADLVNRFVADGDLKKATDLIEENFKTNPNASSDIWKEYATYMAWQKREKEIWVNLNKYYLRFKSKNTADISRKIKLIEDYPNDIVRKQWLTRQIDWKTKDANVLTEYVDYFNEPQNHKKIKQVLKQLLIIQPNSKNASLYINHLIDKRDPDLVNELILLEPCNAAYKELASTIAWTFADNLRFDKALEWEKCAKGIDKETKDFWVLSSSNFERMKEKDFPYYIALLLANDTRKAVKELKNEESCSKELKHLSNKIAIAFADYGNYKKALEWAECADRIAIKDKMSWLYETNNINKLRKVFRKYNAKNPKDYDARSFMATIMLYEGKIEESARIAFSIPSDKIDKKYKRALNKEVKDLELKEQLAIFRKYGDLLDPEIGAQVAKKMRQERGSSISFGSFSINDKLRPNALTNNLTYSTHNSKGDMHSFSFTQSTMYKLDGFPRRRSNVGHDLMGLEYGFTKKSSKKYKYALKGRAERDNFGEFFFQAGAELNYAKKDNFTAFQLDAFPVRSGPGYSLDIYRLQFNVYKEMVIGKKFVPIISLESNYYTDKENDHMLMGRLEYKLIKFNKFKLNPMIEGAGGIGSTDRRSGYPYWMAKERIYGGAGAMVVLGSDKSKFNFSADFGFFLEKNEPTFQRYIGDMSYRITDFTKINLGYEFYTIKNFYSNVIQFGLIYNFK